MTVVQPGIVPTYTPNPAVTLTGYSDTDRTRFLYNGSQFVKAKLAITRPSFAYVGSKSGEVSTFSYKDYKTVDGKYALVNEERYIPVATGTPASGNFVIVGFPAQILASSIVLWSTSNISSYGNIMIYYTYDNPDEVVSPYYFSVASTEIETYDFTEKRTPTESPPSGLYKYTITFTSSITARYFGVLLPNSSAVLKLTEIDVGSSYEPLLSLWNSNGVSASSQDLDHDYYYDITYDKSIGVYYTIRYNNEISGTPGVGFFPSDDFNYTSSAFNTERWTESASEDAFSHNTVSGTAVFLGGAFSGRLTTNYYMDGDFTASIDVGFNTFQDPESSLYLSAIDKDRNNVFLQMGFHGPWVDGTHIVDGHIGEWSAAYTQTTTDTTGGDAYIANLRFNLEGLSSTISQFLFTYDASSELWTAASGSGGGMASVFPGQSYSFGPIDSMSIVHVTTPTNGAQLVLSVNRPVYALSDLTYPWDWKLGLERSGSTYYCKYDDGSGFINYTTVTDTNDYGALLELRVHGIGGAADITLDNFTVTGDDRFDNIHVFSLEAVDTGGNVLVVPGLTDSSGFIIKEFDVINDESDYNSFIDNRVQITTDGLSSGSLYIKVGTDLYKYNKSQFPLMSETGGTAILFKENVIPETSAVAFSYNAYDQAGLCYVEYDEGREGTYLKTISTSTCSGVDNESLLDVSTSNYPFAWDVNNYTVLYYVNSTSLKMYDMDENDVAFCNIASEEKIMGAGTATTSAVTATVMNVYGDTLSSKSVAFTVTAGTGAISPSAGCTNSSGVANTTYTVGASVGITSITAVASDTSC
jgi:hypothetical protein